MAKKKARKTTRKAVKKATKAPRGKSRSRRSNAGAQLETLAGDIVAMAGKGRDPAIDIPLRTLSNVKFNP